MGNTDLRRRLDLYRAMFAARRLDARERELVNRGEAFFYVSASGHEAVAALAGHLTADDWLHCHYRDRALLLARGVSPAAYYHTLLCKDAGPSRGRQMSPFLSDPNLRLLDMVAPVGNGALQAVGVAAAVRDETSRPVVYCGVGDGSTQQGEFLEAMAEAVRSRLPVLFVIQDNGLAISTRTAGRTFYQTPLGPQETYLGTPIHRLNGRDAEETDAGFARIVSQMRHARGPAFVVLDVERLDSHTNADDQTRYRTVDDIVRAAETGDPVRHYRERLIAHGCDEAALTALEAEVDAELAAAEEEALSSPDPRPIFTAKKPLPVELTHPGHERRGVELDAGAVEGEFLTMREALRDVLRSRLADDPRVCLYGEDIEDPKGDVFGVTRGLSTDYPGRVVNSPLSEATIVGASIGRAMAGQRPVAFIQFADFLPPAYNQIVSELASIHWRSAGKWSTPVILMVACGGYRPGLGPFHAQTNESVLAHTPGLDVMMPATAADAAGLLNAAFESGRPTLFYYPKALLNDPRIVVSGNVREQFTPLGVARRARPGRDLTLVGWGNTVKLCEKAAGLLEAAGVEAEVLDLRSLSPWDERAVIASAERTSRLLVVHEDNATCGFGAEVLATVAEKARVPVAMRRVARPDVHVPCNFANQIETLPSLKHVVETAADMLDLDVEWQTPPAPQDGLFAIEAIGSGPSDETVQVLEFYVEPGDAVAAGQPVVSLEASKSVFDLTAPTAGMVESIDAAEGDTLAVGASLCTLRTEAKSRRRPVTQEQPGTPVFTRRNTAGRVPLPRSGQRRRRFHVGLSRPASAVGSRLVTNEELLTAQSDMTAEDIVRRTGIAHRYWAGPGEDPVTLGAAACRELLDREGLLLSDLDMVICSTTSPTSITPSMACRICDSLATGKTRSLAPAFDMSAACSGYLYALQSAYDFLQSTPEGRVLVVTTEVLSPLLDRDDFDTAILFGDAASATVLYGEDHFNRSAGRVHRPELSAKSEDGRTLSVPLQNGGFIQMHGKRVFSEAVKSMISSLQRVCRRAEWDVCDLRWVAPHQANGRILDAIASRIGAPVYSNIDRYGNTSSTSIPLCLSDLLPQSAPGDRLGLCAFGGGFTFGAGLVETN
ncbi:MAG: beta-ketoacyl-ACP synthase 3 [Planctomycetes bacterium]|nr:beta-ketoacyl-ACP synthase 3 [Planctomycetota bacterium]